MISLKNVFLIFLTTALSISFPVFAQGSRPFAELAGTWVGGGGIDLADGSRERLRCRATYRVENTHATLKLSLRCASDSYRFDLTADAISDGNEISGRWAEASRSISGSLLGRASGRGITARVEATGFSATLSLTTHNSRQSVVITSDGQMRNVSISMSRG